MGWTITRWLRLMLGKVVVAAEKGGRGRSDEVVDIGQAHPRPKTKRRHLLSSTRNARALELERSYASVRSCRRDQLHHLHPDMATVTAGTPLTAWLPAPSADDRRLQTCQLVDMLAEAGIVTGAWRSTLEQARGTWQHWRGG